MFKIVYHPRLDQLKIVRPAYSSRFLYREVKPCSGTSFFQLDFLHSKFWTEIGEY